MVEQLSTKLEDNDPTLLSLVQCWIAGGYDDPRADITLKAEKIRLTNWVLGILCILPLAVIWMAISLPVEFRSLEYSLALLFIIVVAWKFWKLFRIQSQFTDEQNVDEFINTIKLIQRIYQIRWEEDPASWTFRNLFEQAGPKAELYLRQQAKKSSRLFKARFDRRLIKIAILLQLPTDYNVYCDSKLDYRFY